MADRRFTHEVITERVPKSSNKISENVEEEIKCLQPCGSTMVPNNHLAALNIKDVGYAWVVLAAMFVSNVLTTGYLKGFGLIYNKIYDVYPNASGTIAGIMMGLLIGCRSMFAPLAGALGNLCGVRKTMFFGGLLYCTGLIASFFCTDVTHLLFTAGAMIGLSHCIIESLQVTVISQYFDSKLSTANGIRVAGNPCGGMLYPFMLTFLLQEYGLRLSFVLLAGITTHIFVCAMLIRPIETHTKIKLIDFIRKVSKDEEFNVVHLTTEPTTRFAKSKAKLVDEYININARSAHKRKKPLEFKFLKNVVYLCFVVMAAGLPIGFPLILYYMTIFAKTVIGLSPYEISTLLCFQAMFDFCLRIFLGWLNNKNLYEETHGFIFCLWLGASGSMFMCLADSLPFLYFSSILYSFTPAYFHVCINVILCKQFGKESIASTWGFVRMTQGIFSFIHPTLIGYLVDTTGGFTVPFIVMGFGMIFCSLMVIFNILLTKYKNKNNIVR